MNYIIKLSVILVVCAVLALLIKKQNPELAMLLGVVGTVGCLFSCLELVQHVFDTVRHWQQKMQLTAALFVPLGKCLGIAIVSQFGVNVCKDAGQNAAASALELCGNIAAAWCLLPLLQYLFELIEDMLCG